jgi:hypothetical protein
MTKKWLHLAVSAGIAAIVGATVAATPAQATDIGAYRDDYNPSGCDAMLYASDTTSSGKVEAFGGFNCPTSAKMTGSVTVKLFKNGSAVCTKSVSYNLVSTAHAECAVTDPSGNQNWKSWIQILDAYGLRSFYTGEMKS